jgi:hypothetical protein
LLEDVLLEDVLTNDFLSNDFLTNDFLTNDLIGDILTGYLLINLSENVLIENDSFINFLDDFFLYSLITIIIININATVINTFR